MAYITLTAGAIAAIIAALAAAGGTATGVQVGNANASASSNKALANYLRQSHPELSQSQIEALVAQYGDDGFNLFNANTWTDKTDRAGLEKMLDDINNAYNDLGTMPEFLSLDELTNIENQARGEIDAENRQILDLYDQAAGNVNNLLQQQFDENNQMFADYRNQALTNEAMQQQAIAGSTRYELDRSKRNAIIRGASAAQRLVANINTQLGMQAKSAQQSLDTSNALAQQLLAHRQAQSSLRQDYMNNMNQNLMNRANLLKGGAERKLSYAQSQMDHTLNRNQYARDAWNNRVNDYFQGNSLGEGIYRNRYGSAANRNNNNNSY